MLPLDEYTREGAQLPGPRRGLPVRARADAGRAAAARSSSTTWRRRRPAGAGRAAARAEHGGHRRRRRQHADRAATPRA